ncbi:MAG: RNA polymerase sigma factor [Parcubacteria group bacterium GW2011_GWF2_38_76]|nr:MAG: RNA polymerase sigma factor [Parcubacteria group bacterium GW2011_GWF2_38_76]
MSKQHKLTFNPKKVTKDLLGVLPIRARDIIKKRYGLDSVSGGMTLEAIGETYGITRERVRQIENFALNSIRKSDAYTTNVVSFDELRKHMDEYGGVVHEQDFLDHLTSDKELQNHVSFYLELGNDFIKLKEDEEFSHRWTIDEGLSKKVHDSLKKLYESLSEDDLISESEMIIKFLDHLEDTVKDIRNEELAKRWIKMSKKIGKNALGEWGVAHSPNIRVRGIRDLAYLVLRKHGSPMHFREVAKAIKQIFGKNANEATCHNELIKDKRFVLVGRGLYALSKWGYSQGTVRDIIKTIIKDKGPQSRDEILKKVLRERYIKENTVLVNLQNKKYFKKDKNGKYLIV